MRLFIFIFLSTFLLACKKEENKKPVCRFSQFGQNGSPLTPVVYKAGDTMATLGQGYNDYNLYYDQKGRIIRKEEPASNPYYRSELEYNVFGMVTELRQYTKRGGIWQYEAKTVYIYENGKLVEIGPGGLTGPASNHYYKINWQGNDIVSVAHWFNQQVDCTVTFTHDNSKLNPMRSFTDFYFVDGNTNDVRYKLPYYFSEHVLASQDDDCGPLSEPFTFQYTFNSSGLVESVSTITDISTGSIYLYDYECR